MCDNVESISNQKETANGVNLCPCSTRLAPLQSCDHQLFNGLGSAEPFIGLIAGFDVAHFHLDERIALAGQQHFGFEHVPLFAVMLDDVAGPNGIRLDFHR